MNALKSLGSAAVVTAIFCVAGAASANDATEKRIDQQSESTQTRSTRAHLGIGVESLPPVLTSHLPEVIGKGRGILISNVSEGSPAANAGLQKHDVLIRYDDQDLYSPEQLVKRVRNDEPGKEVALQYVRAGKLETVNVKLGETPRTAPIENSWPGLTDRFDVPLVPHKPEFLTERQDASNDGTEWTHFESMTLTKGKDGKYTAKVKYKDEEGTSIDREYAGTRQEVRDAIEADGELPESQKAQLLRSLDDRGEGEFKFPKLPMPTGPNWMPWGRELFHWPDVNF